MKRSELKQMVREVIEEAASRKSLSSRIETLKAKIKKAEKAVSDFEWLVLDAKRRNDSPKVDKYGTQLEKAQDKLAELEDNLEEELKLYRELNDGKEYVKESKTVEEASTPERDVKIIINGLDAIKEVISEMGVQMPSYQLDKYKQMVSEIRNELDI
jgi:hypothetical protein